MRTGARLRSIRCERPTSAAADHRRAASPVRGACQCGDRR
ncbi:hypothetical protein RSPO_m01311 (plasmid) [Ralstonia solanacearum Po82]|uniref:Uncharacterized protein n=1 Tax=Ralstonia solanacearum (strain Po82) TaxID=1031711 RepID=F6G9N1_RALS8|nr:hypothetical protein RSPO_m01311 [Ralstonia solanacearum Po82]